MSMEKPTTSAHAKSKEENSPTSAHEDGSLLTLSLSNDYDWSIIQLSNTKEESVGESKETPVDANKAASDKSDKEYTDGYYQMAAEIDRIIYEDSACSQPPPETACAEPDRDSTDDEYSIVSFADLERLMVADERRRRRRNLCTSGKYTVHMAILFKF
ncbi:hypothetical protein PPYR_05298 [Photinus pyralis]|uniref:Uncharacterized protein n=1 Tax=Photinus pyralis TaxID=7054 RepID=A0A1Y1LZN5_PHOPY|nr:hypothetical protein PPYR_05298 [Photinus pyralis]